MQKTNRGGFFKVLRAKPSRTTLPAQNSRAKRQINLVFPWEHPDYGFTQPPKLRAQARALAAM